MNYLFLIPAVMLLSTSCCGAKQPTTTDKIVKTDAQETPKPPETVVEEVIEVEEITPKPDTPIVETPVVEDAVDVEETEPETPAKPQTVFDHSIWNNLLQKYVSNDGKVNYKGFKNDRSKLKTYINLLSGNTPTNSWSKNEKLAYWINAYNTLTVDLIVRNYPVKSIKDINDPWKQRLWKLGDKWYNLEEIEHQILRKMNEPRIHFAIVCASYSCPKLANEAYNAEILDTQLTKATKDFLSDKKRNEITPKKVKLSKIFSWFAKDFKQNGSLIDFLNTYSEVKISKNAKKTFKEYIWTLNE